MFLLEMGSFTNVVLCIYVLKIEKTKLPHTLTSDCFLTCKNQLFFVLKVEK